MLSHHNVGVSSADVSMMLLMLTACLDILKGLQHFATSNTVLSRCGGAKLQYVICNKGILSEFDLINQHAKACHWLPNISTVFYDWSEHHGGAVPVRDISLWSRSCSFNIKLHGDIWHIVSSGPFYGRGDYDWHVGSISAGMPSKLETAPSHFITGAFAVPMDELEANYFRRPPLQIHHSHCLGRENGKRFDAELFASDSSRMCASHDGGLSCMVTSLPAGYGHRIAHPDAVFFDFMLNDVRPRPVKPLPFVHRVGWRYSSSKNTRAVGQLVFDQGVSIESWNEYILSPSSYLVTWYSHQWPTSGTMLLGHIHSHPDMLSMNMVFTCLPTQLSLPNMVSSSFLTTRSEYEALYAHLMHHTDRLCWQDALDQHADRLGGNDMYRYTPTLCKPLEFSRGDDITVVSMTPPVGGRGKRNHRVFAVAYQELQNGTLYDMLWMRLKDGKTYFVDMEMSASLGKNSQLSDTSRRI